MPFLYIFFALLLSSCASMRHTPEVPKQKLLERGWSFVESEQEFLKMEAGVQALNFSAPVIIGNRIIYGSSRFGLTVLNKIDGRTIWQKGLNSGAATDVAIFEKMIFIGANDGHFFALDLKTGKEVWKIKFPYPTVGKPSYSNGRILVATIDDSAHALDASTGKKLWSYQRRATGRTSIKGGGNSAFISGKFWLGFSDGTIVALDPNDGSVKLEQQYSDNPKFTDIDAQPVAWKNGVLVASYDGKLRYLRKDGKIIWEYNAGGAHKPLTTNLLGGTIFLPASDGNVYAIKDKTAKLIWRFNIPRGIPTSLILFEGRKNILVATSSNNDVIAIDATTGKELASVQLGSSSGSYSAVVADKKMKQFFVLSHYGRIHQFKLRQ